MDEVFGYRPNRPQHPDFWKLTEIILGLDGAVEAGEDVNHTRLGKAVDLTSVRYTSVQRAKRTLLFAKEHSWPPVRALAAAWLDGFPTGHQLGVQDLPGVGEAPKPGREPGEMRSGTGTPATF
jgi:hypothetical protein